MALGGFRCSCLVPPLDQFDLAACFYLPLREHVPHSSKIKNNAVSKSLVATLLKKQAKGLNNKKTVFIRTDMREICQACEVLWRPAETNGCLGTKIQKDVRVRLVALPLTGPNLEFQKCFRNTE